MRWDGGQKIPISGIPESRIHWLAISSLSDGGRWGLIEPQKKKPNVGALGWGVSKVIGSRQEKGLG
jgi:hypothetical protein